MKLLSSLFQLSVVAFFSVCACSSSATKDEVVIPAKSDDSARILIVYLSRTSNTKAVADMIKARVGGTSVAIELEKPYPENYRATVEQVARENADGYLPPLKTKVQNLNDYNIVFVGFPTWGMQLPPPMKSFLRSNDLSSKTVIPFNTNGGYGIGSTFETVASLCPNSKILEGFTTKGGVERDNILLAIKDQRRKEVEQEVQNWLQKIGMLP